MTWMDAVPNGSRPRSYRSLEMLERVARCLDCTPDALMTGDGMPAQLVQTDELLRLWLALRTDDARERVLCAARDAAAGRVP